jgi:hypothetical protein
MKQKIFTLVLMLAMVFVASSAWALNEKTVYAGSTYTYSLANISTANAATASVTYSTGYVTITDPTGTFSIASGSPRSISFQAQFLADATDGYFEVTINDNVSNCSNTIRYNITVMEPPVYTLTIDALPLTTCQAGSGAGHNLADKKGGESNTITYTITPVVQNVISDVDYTYEFDFVLPTNAIFTTLTSTNANVTTYPNGHVVVNGTGTGEGDQGASAVSIAVTFETVVGAQTQTITASLPDVTNTSNASLTIDDGSNAGAGTVIAGAIPTGGQSSVGVQILAVPSMGSFVE